MADDRKAFPLRITKALFDDLKAWADQDMRSVNGQIEFILRDAVRRRRHSDVKTPKGNGDVGDTENPEIIES